MSAPIPTATTIASTSASSCSSRAASIARAQPELDTELGEQPRLVRQRLVRLAVRRDREADEASDLLALVVHRHGVAARRELAGCRETGGAGADDCDALAVRRRALAQRDAVGVGPVGRVSLQRADLDRPPALVHEDAVALAEHLDRADAGAGAAEDVLGEDRCRRGRRVACCDRCDEARDVDAGWAGDDARAPVRAAPPHSRHRSASTTAAAADSGGWSSRVRLARTSLICIESRCAPAREAIGVSP